MAGKRRASTPPLPPDINVYVLGDSWTEAELTYLAPIFAAINAAAEQIRDQCMKSIRQHDISVTPTRTGDGVVCGKDCAIGTYAGIYIGVVHKKKRFHDKYGYSIDLPPIRLSDGTLVPAVLCGHEHRRMQGNASMFNSACVNNNSDYLFQDIIIYKNLEARWKVQRLLDRPGSIVPNDLLDTASEVLFSYAVVVVITNVEVSAGKELRVSYNRGDSGYFSTRKMALTSCKKGEIVAKCMCEEGGCPLNHYFVTARGSK